MRLVSVSTGLTPLGNSAKIIPNESTSCLTRFAVPRAALELLTSVRWNGPLISGAGSHTRVGPENFRTSTRVVTSNVLQPEENAPLVKRPRVFGMIRHADITLADRRKLRRFIEVPP